MFAETISYNGQSILGPTLLWRSGSDVEISVTNELDEGTTAHWHGADVPAEDDGGPHSRIDLVRAGSPTSRSSSPQRRFGITRT